MGSAYTTFSSWPSFTFPVLKTLGLGATVTDRSQGIGPFRDGEVGRGRGGGLRAARVLPKWWGAQDLTARRAAAGEPAGDVGEAGPWGEAQRLCIRGPRADPDGGGCGKLEGGAGSGQRPRQERPRPVPRRVWSPPLPSPVRVRRPRAAEQSARAAGRAPDTPRREAAEAETPVAGPDRLEVEPGRRRGAKPVSLSLLNQPLTVLKSNTC